MRRCVCRVWASRVPLPIPSLPARNLVSESQSCSPACSDHSQGVLPRHPHTHILGAVGMAWASFYLQGPRNAAEETVGLLYGGAVADSPTPPPLQLFLCHPEGKDIQTPLYPVCCPVDCPFSPRAPDHGASWRCRRCRYLNEARQALKTSSANAATRDQTGNGIGSPELLRPGAALMAPWHPNT